MWVKKDISSKYCQEVLISIIDEIQTANVNKKSGALLSLYIRKAFDTISMKPTNFSILRNNS